jgi:hypothetical protein
VEKKKLSPVQIRLFEEDRRFVAIPRFWIDSLLQSKSHLTDANGAHQRKGNRIPASFWLYTFHLWRGIMDGNERRVADISMRQFPVRGDAAVMWTAAYSVSGLFDVEKGKYTSAHDEPTRFAYRIASTKAEWEIFVAALDLALNRVKQLATTNKIDPEASTGGFKVTLAVMVDQMRAAKNLPAVNKKFIDDAVAGRELDGKGRQIAQLFDGVVGGLFYSKGRRKLKSETNEEFEQRVCDELHYGVDAKLERAREWLV